MLSNLHALQKLNLTRCLNFTAILVPQNCLIDNCFTNMDVYRIDRIHMVRVVIEPKQFIKNNSKVLEESIEIQELKKNAPIKEQDLLQSPRSKDLFRQLLIDCENAFLDLQFKSQASILETIPDQVPQFNQLSEQKRAEWQNFIANKHDPLVSAEKLISFWQQGLKICQQLVILELARFQVAHNLLAAFPGLCFYQEVEV